MHAEQPVPRRPGKALARPACPLPDHPSPRGSETTNALTVRLTRFLLVPPSSWIPPIPYHSCHLCALQKPPSPGPRFRGRRPLSALARLLGCSQSALAFRSLGDTKRPGLVVICPASTAFVIAYRLPWTAFAGNMAPWIYSHFTFAGPSAVPIRPHYVSLPTTIITASSPSPPRRHHPCPYQRAIRFQDAT